ncbi:FAD-binding oxidoreductase [Sandaracinobacter sp. RS1-74]|uniref:FAD-binding oxidoreductase n=1 Tax=Sandaracinobacteroides sayramensis TaxID=2913411 RepID=UPI001EDC3F3E|nr:FAD-binding oxidoreductase [Sandaracinobacteroides sayramensis]MCG2840540.1 FAD-binding oxidoreductase [Sandaracinobacteroides sayramensis]
MGNAATQATLAELQRRFGPDLVADGAASAPRQDWSGIAAVTPVAVLRPRGSADVAAIVRACHDLGQPLVVQGGLTGLSGGAVVQPGEAALSLERMTRIESIDPVAGTMVVEAGATLQSVQEAAAAAGFQFALDLGARGSCTIGGNIATNAGGIRVIKYGMMRDQLLGVEAVLADGRLLDNMHHMVKNNSGYDLRNLLAGSEGTLAVITRAVLRLRAVPRSVQTAWCGLPDFESVGRFLVAARATLGDGLSAFEVMWASFHDRVIAHVPGLRRPLHDNHLFHVLVESSAMQTEGHEAAFTAFLARALEEGLLTDAAIARSGQDARNFWAIRECPEMGSMIRNPVVFDISASASAVGRMLVDCESEVSANWPGSPFVALGHLGDGNIHIMVGAPDADARTHNAIEDRVCEVVERHRGSISAEHGIGLKKRRHLGHCRSELDVALMRNLKAALDPANILGRGRIFPA